MTGDDMVTVTLPRSALTVVAPTPETVTKHNCAALFGLTPKDFHRLASKDDVRSTKVGRLVVMEYAEVKRALTAAPRPASVKRVRTVGPRSPDELLAVRGYK